MTVVIDAPGEAAIERAGSRRRVRGSVAMAAVGAVLLVGGAIVVLQAADPFPSAGLRADAATLPSPTTLVAKTHERSVARVLPPVEPVPVAPVEPAPVNLVAMTTPDAAPAAPRATQAVAEHADAPSYPMTLAIPSAVRVRGPVSFAIGKTVYRLSSTDAIGVNACSSRRSGRCYRHPRGDLKTAIAGATLRCRPLGSRSGETLVDCVKAREPG